MKKATVTRTILSLALAIGMIFGAISLTQAAQTAALTSEEKAALAYMVEEEKLARDVYTKMYELWKLNSFRNMAAAEERHMDHVGEVLQAYGIADPTATAKPGVFADARLQKLYNELVKRGSESIEAALAVGAAVEDADIADLESLRAKTSNPEMIAVYDVLIGGSENHMRAFFRQLKARGQEHKPENISESRYAEILAGANSGSGCEDCPGGARNGQPGRGNRQQGNGAGRNGLTGAGRRVGGAGQGGRGNTLRHCDGTCESCPFVGK